MDWFDATVETRRQVAGAVRLLLDVPAPVRAPFTAPGQYLHLKVGSLDGPFALAGAPHAPGPIEVLFKHGTPLTDALAKLLPKAALHVSKVSGPGFPLDKARGKGLLLIASGTGQAPMRSVIESVRRDRKSFGRVTLVLGVRSLEHLAYVGEHPRWET